MTIFLAWVGGITILAFAAVGVAAVGAKVSSKVDLSSMAPDSWVDVGQERTPEKGWIACSMCEKWADWPSSADGERIPVCDCKGSVSP